MIIYLSMTEGDYNMFKRRYPIYIDERTGEYYLDTNEEYFIQTKSSGIPYVLLKYVVNPKDKKNWYKI
jgi:hypothetical protein